MSEQVELLLKSLRLPTFIHHYQRLLDEANEHHWSHVDYLAVLCEQELADRYQRRVAQMDARGSITRRQDVL